jgi:transmembrane 9 superfamily protein 3
LERAIRAQYWYSWVIDDLPVWGLVGEVAENPATGALTPYLYTHRELTLSYNGNHIVEVVLNASELRPL